jgi:hypothetical protein
MFNYCNVLLEKAWRASEAEKGADGYSELKIKFVIHWSDWMNVTCDPDDVTVISPRAWQTLVTVYIVKRYTV